jgi:hypothetical protein
VYSVRTDFTDHGRGEVFRWSHSPLAWSSRCDGLPRNRTETALQPLAAEHGSRIILGIMPQQTLICQNCRKPQECLVSGHQTAVRFTCPKETGGCGFSGALFPLPKR